MTTAADAVAAIVLPKGLKLEPNATKVWWLFSGHRFLGHLVQIPPGQWTYGVWCRSEVMAPVFETPAAAVAELVRRVSSCEGNAPHIADLPATSGMKYDPDAPDYGRIRLGEELSSR